MTSVREIRGPRENLTKVRNPESVQRLALTGAIDSLAGIERMTNLRSVQIERHADPELHRLAGVSAQLEALTVFTDADADFGAVSLMRALTQLLLGTRSSVSAASIASIELARLERLEVLRLHVGDQPGLTIDTSWVPRSRLLELELVGFAFTPQNIDDAAARVDPRVLRLGPLSRELEERLARATGEPPPLAPPWASVVGQILAFDDGLSLALQYCEAWGLDSEYEASEHLENLVEAQDPELRRRLKFDPTADEIWIRAGARADLEAAAAIAASAGAPTGET